MPLLRRGLTAAISLALVVTGCSRSVSPAERQPDVLLADGATDRATLTGAGSTFVDPLLREWISEYRRVAPGVDIGYERTGSVAGARRLPAGTVDFAASEIPLPESDEAFVQVPWAAGAIAVAYNLPGVNELKLSPVTLGGIFGGRITRWNDPAIKSDNDGRVMPATDIRTVHRSDGSGTTRVFTEFLAGAAPTTWTFGAGPTVSWPKGTAAEGSAGVLDAVKKTPGAIGYAEATQATRSGLAAALVGNGARRFVPPSAEAAGAALSDANPAAPDAYPITTVTYVAFPVLGRDRAKDVAVRHFAGWVLTQGQRTAQRLGYAPVPLQVLITALERLDRSG